VTTTATNPSTLAAARARNEATWHQTSSLYYAKRVEDSLAFWREDSRYEAAYPVAEWPAVVEGRDALMAMFTAMVSPAKHIEVHDVRFHQTDDPDVVFVEERMVAELFDGARYDNHNILRLTFTDGLIAEMYEYTGQLALLELLSRLA
jgi:ketosteroid isomerase-like protein